MHSMVIMGFPGAENLPLNTKPQEQGNIYFETTQDIPHTVPPGRL